MTRISKRVFNHFLLLVGAGIILCVLITGFFGVFFVDPQSIRPNLSHHLEAPNFSHPFGFGINGISVLAWLIYGARMSLLVAILVTTFSISVGILFGALSGYFGGKLDSMIMRLTDIILAFPGILLALYLAAIMPPSIFSLVFALSATGWVAYARLVRARILEIKHRDFVLASKALGASHARIIFFHLLPNIIGPIIIQATYGVSIIILAEAGLTFLGLGLPIGTPSWGALLDQGVANLFTSPYLAIYPGILIALTVLGFNFLGDGLRDILDPKTNI